MSAGSLAVNTAVMAAAAGNAVKALGVIVTVREEEFLRVLRRAEAPLVVHAEGGFFSTKHKYLTSYKGLAFFTTSKIPLELPEGLELIESKSIWVPEM